jgi:long-chain acyl-CoA synthetase
VTRGEPGEVCARGPNIMKGYWERPRETAEALRDGWMHTGDVAWEDDAGYLYIVDRIKDMIVTGGENVYSAEVESALYSHPAVREAAVFGVPDEKWGEAVAAVVSLRPGQTVSAEALALHCRSLVASYKVPRRFEFIQEELPKSGAGKILKRRLREPFWRGRDRNISGGGA